MKEIPIEYGLLLIIIYQYWFISCVKCITLMYLTTEKLGEGYMETFYTISVTFL